jgi:hypothetical protein
MRALLDSTFFSELERVEKEKGACMIIPSQYALLGYKNQNEKENLLPIKEWVWDTAMGRERLDTDTIYEQCRTARCLIHLALQPMCANNKEEAREYISNRTRYLDNNCQIFNGAFFTDSTDLGLIKINGYVTSAYRVSAWANQNDYDSFLDLPKNILTRHKCLTKYCINPDHLEFGTHKQNNADIRRDGTQNGISDSLAQSIADSWNSGKTEAERAAEFDVPIACIKRVDRRYNYYNITHPNGVEYISPAPRQPIPDIVDVDVGRITQKLMKDCSVSGSCIIRSNKSVCVQINNISLTETRWAYYIQHKGMIKNMKYLKIIRQCGTNRCVKPAHMLLYDSVKL